MSPWKYELATPDIRVLLNLEEKYVCTVQVLCVHVLWYRCVFSCLSPPAFMDVINGGPVGFNGWQGANAFSHIDEESSGTMGGTPVRPLLMPPSLT